MLLRIIVYVLSALSCCPNPVLGQGEGCWWSGCQPNDWAVRGCPKDMKQINSTGCDKGDYYHCCPKDQGESTDNPLEQGKVCWWTACQTSSWEVKGCGGNTDEISRETCDDGSKYRCCEKIKGPPEQPPLNCWWSGCQPFDWAFRGCPNTTLQVDSQTCKDKKPGDKYLCCDVKPEDIVPSDSNDHGFGDYQNYVKFLLLKANKFSVTPERLPCVAVDPEKKYIFGVGEDEGIRICDLCPNLPFSKLRNIFINNNPMNQSANLNFQECFSFCVDDDKCMALSFDQIDKTCYIYNSTYGLFQSETNYTTVLINQPVGVIQKWVYSRHSKTTGKSLTNPVVQPSFLKCLEVCQDTAECSQVSYSFADNQCTLFDGVNQPGFLELEYGYVSAITMELSHQTNDVTWRFQEYNDKSVDDDDDSGRSGSASSGPCSRPSNPELDVYYSKECVTSGSLGCDRATSCKTCYYPEIAKRYRNDLTICPNSTVLTNSGKGEKLNLCMQNCFRSNDCLAVEIDDATSNCELIGYQQLSKQSEKKRYFLQYVDKTNQTKSNLNHFNLLLGHELKSIDGSSAFFRTVNTDDWNQCLNLCMTNNECVKVSFSKSKKVCNMATNIAQVIDRRNDPSNDFNLFFKKAKLTSTELAFKRTPGWYLHHVDAWKTSQNPCSGSSCSLLVPKCQNDCLKEYGDWCGFISAEYYTDKVICHFFPESLNGTLEANSQREVFTRYFDIRFNLVALNNLSLFQIEDMYTCFQSDQDQTQESLNDYQDPYSLAQQSGAESGTSLRRKRGIFDGIKKFFKKVGKGIKDFVVGTAKKIKDTAVGVVKTISNVVQGKFDKAKESFLNIPIVKSVKEVGQNVVKLGSSLVKGDWKGVKDAGLGLVTSDVLDFVPGGKVVSTAGKILKGITKSGAKGAKGQAAKNSKDGLDKKVTKDRGGQKRDNKDDPKKDKERPGSECENRPKRQTALGKRKRPTQTKQCNKSTNDKCVKPDTKRAFEKSLSDCHLTKVNSRCAYECEAGYTEDPKFVTCRKSGQVTRWSPDPKCDHDKCGAGAYRIIPVKIRPPLLNLKVNGEMVAFVIYLDRDRRLPIWSAAVHDKLNTVPVIKRFKPFYKHPCLNDKQQATSADYAKSGWDQGHLTPANVMLFTRKASMSSNLFINVAPQDPFTNKGYWKVIEGHVACFSKRVSSIVVTGVCPGSIGKSNNRLDIPSCFWKMICYKDSSKGKTFVVGFLVDNTKIGSNKNAREKRRSQLKKLVSQSAIKAKLSSNAIYSASDPWLQSSKDIFGGRPGIPPVNTLDCSNAQAMDPVEEKEWTDAIAGKGTKTKGKREASGEPRGCTPEEAKAMALFLGVGTLSLDNFSDQDLAPEDKGSDGEEGPLEGGGSIVPAASCGKKMIGYYPSWGKNKFTFAQAQRLTHVIFAFLEMKADGTVLVGNPDLANSKNPEEDVATAKDRLKQMLRVAKAFNHLKILFAVGGWENSQFFSAVASSQSLRLKFIASVIKNIDEYGFDGVDIDWEYPVTGGAHEGVPADKSNYVQLMKELREALTEHAKVMQRKDPYLISFAGAAGQWTLDPGFDLPGLLKYADFVNVMTYDFFGAWESKWGAYTGPPAPLFFGMPPRYSGKTNADWTMKYYVCRSQQPHKINMGVPFYGRYWKNVGDPVDGKDECWRTAQAVNGKFEGGYVGYRDIQSKYLDDAGFQKRFHEKAKAPFAFNPGTKTYLGYEDTRSLKFKKEYAAQKNLGGMMIWAIDQDDDDLTMLKAVFDASLCDNTNPKDIKHKCSPITEKRWWTVEDGEDVAGLCGRSAPLYKGFYPVCDPDDPGYSCCGEFGYCGFGDKFCSCPTCVDFGSNPEKILTEPIKPTIPVAWYFLNAPDGKRGRCGRKAPLLNGKYPICNPDDPNAHCCSNGNYCGSSKGFCECEGCIDFKKNPNYQFKPKRWWDWGDGPKLSGKCGPSAPKVDGHMAECDPDTKYYCCSKGGNCGEGKEFCDCDGCVNYKKK